MLAFRNLSRGVLVSLGTVLALGSSASAATITLSDVSSGNNPGASLLDATFVFTITGPTELTLTVTNDTAAPDIEFDINQVFFNALPNVTGLSLDSATHSAAGDVTAEWGPVETSTMVDGFGIFDFGLTDGTGMGNPSQIGPGESIDFILTILGTGPFADTDFVSANQQGKIAAAKFVNGHPGNKSGIGAAVPEPTTAALLGLGMLGLAVLGRRPR